MRDLLCGIHVMPSLDNKIFWKDIVEDEARNVTNERLLRKEKVISIIILLPKGE